MNKERLCEAFCGELEVREVPAGVAVKTAFRSPDGDAVSFYITRHKGNPALWRIEDAGMTVPLLEAHGVNLDSGMRAEAFEKLLSEHQATYDDDLCELHSHYVHDDELPAAAMRFISLMLRVRDLELLSPEVVANTFREDAQQSIRTFFTGKADLIFSEPVAENLPDFVPDVVISPRGGEKKLALYIATSEQKVDEAVMLWMEAKWHQRTFDVAVLLETEKPAKVGNRSLRRAMNRVSLATYRGDEEGAMQRIARYAGMGESSWH